MNKFSPEVFEKKDLPFTVNRLSPTIGGEILGIDLSQPIDFETKDLIYEALLVYKVIFFRDQNISCLLYTSPSPRDRQKSRMPSSA